MTCSHVLVVFRGGVVIWLLQGRRNSGGPGRTAGGRQPRPQRRQGEQGVSVGSAGCSGPAGCCHSPSWLHHLLRSPTARAPSLSPVSLCPSFHPCLAHAPRSASQFFKALLLRGRLLRLASLAPLRSPQPLPPSCAAEESSRKPPWVGEH